MSAVKGQVQWCQLDQPTFDRFVEPLITRLHLTDDPDLEVDVLDGRGGDKGIDIDVRRNGRLLHVYQLKFFPEGFSNQWAKARKPQIKRSFETAMKLSPERWTLIVPRNLTIGERDFVSGLKKAHKAKVSVLGQAKLDELMARFPDLLRWATREPLLEALKTIHLERQALAGIDDYREAIESIQAMADSRSPNWTVGHALVDGEYTETLTAKHPLAQEREPFGLQSLRIEIPAENVELGERANRVLRYGDNESLTLSSEYLKDIDFRAPSWSQYSKPFESPMITFPGRESIRENVEVEFQVVDDEDVVIRSYTGTSTHLGKGSGGAILKAMLRGGVEVTMLMDLITQEEPEGSGTFNFKHNYRGVPATDAEVGVHFVTDMLTYQKIRLLLDGNFLHSFMGGQVRTRPQKDTNEYLESDTVLLVEDLAVIERELQISLPVPDTITNHDRLLVRVLRLLLNGHVVVHPFISSFNGELSDSIGPETIAVIRQRAGAIIIDNSRLIIDLFGKKVAVGAARFAINHAEIANADDILAAIESGNYAGHPLQVRPHRDEGIKIFLPNRVHQQDQDGELTVTPWGVPGISEHNELRGVTAPPDVDS